MCILLKNIQCMHWFISLIIHVHVIYILSVSVECVELLGSAHCISVCPNVLLESTNLIEPGRMVRVSLSQKSTWKYGLMVWVSCIRKSLYVQKLDDNLQIFWICVHHHHAIGYQSSLLTLHIRLVHIFITQKITWVVSWCSI